MEDQAQVSKYISFRNLCITNAEDALRAADLLKDQKLNHIVYHLSVLALEEIGKVFIGWYNLTQEGTWEKDKTNMPIDDHVKKLFFAVWGPTIAHEKITKEQFEQHRGFAKQLHEKRLDSLYTDLSDEIQSSDKIPNEEAIAVLNFARATLNLTENAKLDDKTPRPSDDANWFIEASDDPIKRRYIFGNLAQDKLIELGDIDKWILWLKEKFEKDEEATQSLMQDELKRTIPTDQNKIKQKWKVKVKFISSSHIIKANVLASFNKLNPHVQLYKGKDTHTLVADFILGNNVSVTQIWDYGWLVSRFYVAAINIGTNGLFYWNTIIETEKFYEEITDIENKTRLNARLESGLTLNWSERMMELSEKELVLSQIAYEYIVGIQNAKQALAINQYLIALGLLSKNDIHSRFELEVFMHFYHSMKIAVESNEVLANNDNWQDVAYEQIGQMLKTKNVYDEVMAIASEIERQKKPSKIVTLTEIIGMKQYCGYYLLTLAVRFRHKDNTLRLKID